MRFQKTSIALAAMTLCGAAHAAPTNLAFRQPAANATITKDINQSSACELTGSGIVRAEFYLGGRLLNREGNAPWNCNIDIEQFQSGTYTLRGVAFASNGTSASKEISVRIDRGDGGGTTEPVPPVPPQTGYTGTPYTGTPVALPKAFAAVDFDRGGQGVAYNDRSSGNAGGLYRSGEGVDIIAASGDPISPYAINGFQTGEWLAYTVNVPASGKYDLAIKAATNYSLTTSFHIEVDGVDVTGRISVPKTGSWSSFQWVGKQGIDLAAGKRVVKVVADAEYFNLQAVSVLANATTPPPTTPPTEPALPAVSFLKPLANATVSDMVSGSSCEAKVTANGSAIRNVQFYVDGTALNLEGSAPYNCNFDTTKVLDGTRKLKAVATDMNGKIGSAEISVNVANGGGGTTEPTPPASGGSPNFSCSFENGWADCGFSEQAKVIGSRATLVSTAREGGKSVRLHTLSGDSNVNGSGSWERNDLSLGSRTDCSEGKVQWWGHSVLFPSDYVVPNSGGVVMDFHHTGSSGQANFHVDAMSYGLRLRGYGGNSVDSGRYEVTLGPVVRNQWYDFVYHVKWSSGSDGYMHAWVNGQKKLTHYGPTLYKGMGCYLKLANYHDPFGKASSVIHDRVRRGSSAADVSLTPLQ